MVGSSFRSGFIPHLTERPHDLLFRLVVGITHWSGFYRILFQPVNKVGYRSALEIGNAGARTLKASRAPLLFTFFVAIFADICIIVHILLIWSY